MIWYTLTIFGICIGGFWIWIEGFWPSNLTMKVLNPGHFKPRVHQGPGGSEARKAWFFNEWNVITPMVRRISLKYTKMAWTQTYPKHFMGNLTFDAQRWKPYTQRFPSRFIFPPALACAVDFSWRMPRGIFKRGLSVRMLGVGRLCIWWFPCKSQCDNTQHYE